MSHPDDLHMKDDLIPEEVRESMRTRHLPRFEDVYPTLPARGWLTEPEARLLWDTARATEGAILEVGSYHGRSTCLLAALGRTVYAVDPFAGFDSDDPDGRDALGDFFVNLESRGITAGIHAGSPRPGLEERVDVRVRLFIHRVEDWQSRPAGFAYLDGDHSLIGTRNQISAALQCGPQAIAMHDVNDHGGGLEVKRAALELLGPWKHRVERLAVWELQR